jgi:hypothetical protein
LSLAGQLIARSFLTEQIEGARFQGASQTN